MRVLIFGALGNLGHITARKLSGRDSHVNLRLTSHRAEGLRELREKFPGAEIVHADWNDEASLREAVRDIDRVLVVMTDFVIDESIATANLIRALESEGRVQTVLRFIALPPGLTATSLSPDVLATRAGAMLTLVAKPLLDASSLPVCYVNAACWITYNIEWFFGADIRERREIRMPAETDMPRQWVSEGDLSDAFVRILTDTPSAHSGREYLVTGGRRYGYADLAEIVSDTLAQDVRWIDDDSSLRRIMGSRFETLMTYLRHEVIAYRDVPATRELELLLGRERTSLPQYVESIRASLL